MKSPLERAICALAVTLATTVAHAQSAQSDQGTVIITGSRVATPPASTPVNMTVLSADDIARSGASTLANVLAQQAGIAVHDLFGSNAAYATLDIRGFGTTGGQNVVVLLNGRRLTDMDSAGVAWSQIPVLAIERIEIMRGGGAVLYGDNAAGGTINIITRSALNAVTPNRIKLRAGSEGAKGADVFVNASDGNLAASLAASRFRSDGYRDNNNSREQSIETKFDWRIGATVMQLSLGGDDLTMRLPGPRCVANCASGRSDYRQDRRGTATPNDDSARRASQAALTLRHQFDAGEFALDASVRDRNQWIQSSTAFKYRESDLKVFALSPSWRSEHQLFGARATFVLGADLQDWDYRFLDAQDKASKGTPFSRVRADQENRAVYAQETLALTDRMTVQLGARTERQRLAARNNVDAGAPGWDFAAAAAPESRTRRQHATELGLRYRLSDTWALTARAARAYRFGNIDESFEYDATFNNSFQPLRPQTNRLAELGTSWSSGADLLALNVFQNDVRNEIHLDPFTAGIGNTNLPPSRRRGAELQARRQVTETLTLAGNYTWMRARFLDGVLPGGPFTPTNIVIDGKRVPLVPEHKANLSLSWQPVAATRINLSADYVSRQIMENDEANTLGRTIPAYTVANLTAEQRIADWTLSLAVNNLFDRKYYNYAVASQFTAGRFNAYPLPERTVQLAAEWRF